MSFRTSGNKADRTRSSFARASVYTSDILSAQREILIVSPFITHRRAVGMIPHLENALRSGIRVVVVTRGIEDKGNSATVQTVIGRLRDAGATVMLRTAIHQKFAVLDQRIVWYGSINLLGYGNAEERIMRLDSPAIAHELMKAAYPEYPPPDP